MILARQPGSAGPSRPHRARSGAEARGEGDCWVRCATCGARLAHQSWMLDEAGRAPLVFTNPHGIVFHLLLVTRVVGTLFEGVPTREFTWFKGYLWSVGCCSRCLSHVGWHFSAARTDVELRHFVALSRAAVRFELDD